MSFMHFLLKIITCFCLIFSACLFVDLYAGPDYRIRALRYTNSEGEEGLTTYIYNHKGIQYKAVWELLDGSRFSINQHQFDDHGHMIYKFRTFSDGLTSEQKFYYNDHDQLESETFDRSDGISGRAIYHWTGNNLDSATCKGLNGWFYGTIHYHRNDAYRTISANLRNMGQHIGEITYEYNNLGQLQTEQWTFTNGFFQTFMYEYEYVGCMQYDYSNVFIQPACRFLLAEENYDFSGQSGGPSFFNYNDENKLIEKRYVRSDSLSTRTTYDYVPNGQLKSSTRHYNDGKTGWFIFMYDTSGLLIKKEFIRSDGMVGKETMVYDPNGHLINMEYVNVDGWLSGTITFDHDRYDRLKSGHYKGIDGSEAKLDFRYDQDRNLVAIHWIFSSDHTQTYSFKYQVLQAFETK